MLVDGEVDTRQLLDSWLERGVQFCLQPLQKEGAHSTCRAACLSRHTSPCSDLIGKHFLVIQFHTQASSQGHLQGNPT